MLQIAGLKDAVNDFKSRELINQKLLKETKQKSEKIKNL
jgi:hypothetical protein